MAWFSFFVLNANMSQDNDLLTYLYTAV